MGARGANQARTSVAEAVTDDAGDALSLWRTLRAHAHTRRGHIGKMCHLRHCVTDFAAPSVGFGGSFPGVSPCGGSARAGALGATSPRGFLLIPQPISGDRDRCASNRSAP